jgi:isopenicillin N synthase-like dioxygenase
MHSNIPTIDFSRFLNRSSHDRQQTAFEVDNALRNVDFFHLVNHGIDRGKIDTCFEWVS